MRRLLCVVAWFCISVSAHAQGVTASGSSIVPVGRPQVPPAPPLLSAASISLVTDRASLGGSSVLDWRVLDEPPYNRVPNPFSASSEGVKFVGNFASNSRTAEIHRQSSNAPGYIWMGNFLPGESVLWAPGTAPITLSFSQPLAAVGAQVQPNFYGEFVAQIDVYRGTTRVATFTTPGNGTNKEDGSAAFIGVKDDSGATITSVVFSLLSCQSSCSDFAINQVSFR